MTKKEVSKYLDDINTKAFKEILEYNLNFQDEKILIIGDKGKEGHMISPILSNAFKKAAEELEAEAEMILQEVKWKGDKASEEVRQALKDLPEESIIILNMSGKIGKLETLSFRKFCRKKGHRFTSASSLSVIPTENIKNFLNAYDVDYEELSRQAHKLKEMFDEAEEIRVSTEKGTDVKYNVKGMKAKVSDAIYREPGTGGNLPGTETYLPPLKKNVDGTIVIDGSYRTREGTKLVENPIEMTIKEGVVVAMNDVPESEDLEETLRWAHEKAKYPWGVRRIGELGVGLNPKAEVIGCTVIDEKAKGTGHFAIGSNHWFGGSIYAIIHLDQVFHDPVIYVDGEKVDLENL